MTIPQLIAACERRFGKPYREWTEDNIATCLRCVVGYAGGEEPVFDLLCEIRAAIGLGHLEDCGHLWCDGHLWTVAESLCYQPPPECVAAETPPVERVH